VAAGPALFCNGLTQIVRSRGTEPHHED
jgi:hypothetical protein